MDWSVISDEHGNVLAGTLSEVVIIEVTEYRDF